jgi:hypothetical protein
MNKDSKLAEFNKIKNQLLMYDPIVFIEKHLMLEGQPFKLIGTGFKPFLDIYRYIGIKALEPSSKPVIFVKGRQVGGTTMAGALECFFMGSGLFGKGNRPPMRIIHTFPILEQSSGYSKAKLSSLINTSLNEDGVSAKKDKKSFMQNLIDSTHDSSNSLSFKQFEGGNQLWIEATGADGDRLRGKACNLHTFLPTPSGFIQLRDLKEGDKLFDERGDVCRVTKLHPILESPESYKLIFENGEEVDACKDHLWKLSSTFNNEIKTTKELFDEQDKEFTITCPRVEGDEDNWSFRRSEFYDLKILSIKKIDSIPMRCITVDSPSHLYLITKSFIPTHNTADLIFIDEFQDTPSGAVSNILNMLKQSKYGEPGKGVRVFFGTPKKKGSDFYKLWAASSQQFFHLGCGQCKAFFPLYTPGSEDWEKIWIHTFVVKCPHCGCEQNKNEAAERGKWVPNADPNEKDYVGFHINQLYMPHISKETIMSEKPGTHPTNTERAYQNEVLGEFYQGDSSPITMEEIETLCGDKGRKMRSKIPIDEGLKVFLGIDYGARSDLEQMADSKKKTQQGQSYTTAVILAVKGPKLFSIEFALKFKRNDIESKKSLIDKLMRDYGVNVCVGDIGFSQDFSTMMHTSHGDRYLVSRATGNLKNLVNFNEESYPKEITFHRDHYIGEMFELLKGGNIRFPFGDYDKIGWLVQHCASMDIKPSISRFGDPSIHYVKGGEPNDGLMALLNAYIAYKFYATNGFKTKNPLLIEQNMKQKKQPLAIVGQIKRRM